MTLRDEPFWCFYFDIYIFSFIFLLFYVCAIRWVMTDIMCRYDT